jgi:hypothetical protein
MSNSNYNTKNEIYNKSENNFEDLDHHSLSVLDLKFDKITDNQPLKVWRQKSLPKIDKTIDYLIDLWNIELVRNLERKKASKLSIGIDAFIQYLFSDKVRAHHITTEMRQIKLSDKKQLAAQINNKINKIFDRSISSTHRPTSSEPITLSISLAFTKAFFKNFGIALKDIEASLIRKTLLIEVQSHKFYADEEKQDAATTQINNKLNEIFDRSISSTHRPTSSEEAQIENIQDFKSYSKGYYVNRGFIKFWQQLKMDEGQIESKISQTYNLIKENLDKGSAVYSFNKDLDFVLDFASGRHLSIKSIKLDKNNCDKLETGNLVFNQINSSVFDIKKIKSRLEAKQNRLADDVLKGKRSFEKAQHLDLQIDILINMFNFMQEFGYWIDLYRVGKNGRLYAQGITFQNISKELRAIVFPKSKFENRDQVAAHPNIIYDLSEDCDEKKVLGIYLENIDRYHAVIKEECGLGKKAIKKRRSYATQGYVFKNDVMLKSECGKELLLAIQSLYLKLDPKEIVREEIKRTFGLIGDSEIMSWLHDGAIVLK